MYAAVNTQDNKLLFYLSMVDWYSLILPPLFHGLSLKCPSLLYPLTKLDNLFYSRIYITNVFFLSSFP